MGSTKHLFNCFSCYFSETSKGGIMIMSNSLVENLIVFRWISFWSHLIFRLIALFFLRFKAVYLFWYEIITCIYINKRYILYHIFTYLFIGEYHVNGVQTLGSIETTWISVCVSRIYLFRISNEIPQWPFIIIFFSLLQRVSFW